MDHRALAVFALVTATASLVRSGTAQATGSLPLWYQARIVRDLTGDGRLDTLLLQARGTQPDSLHVVFRIRSEGREVYHQEWSNEDEFEDFSFPQDARARADSIARFASRRLRSFLGPDRIAPLDTSQAKEPWKVGEDDSCQGDPRDCIAWYLRFEDQVRKRLAAGRDSLPPPGTAYRAFIDSVKAAPFDTVRVRAIWNDMRRHTPYAFAMSYGYETTLTIAWSQLAQRFFVVFSCC